MWGTQVHKCTKCEASMFKHVAKRGVHKQYQWWWQRCRGRHMTDKAWLYKAPWLINQNEPKTHFTEVTLILKFHLKWSRCTVAIPKNEVYMSMHSKVIAQTDRQYENITFPHTREVITSKVRHLLKKVWYITKPSSSRNENNGRSPSVNAEIVFVPAK